MIPFEFRLDEALNINIEKMWLKPDGEIVSVENHDDIARIAPDEVMITLKGFASQTGQDPSNTYLMQSWLTNVQVVVEAVLRAGWSRIAIRKDEMNIQTDHEENARRFVDSDPRFNKMWLYVDRGERGYFTGSASQFMAGGTRAMQRIPA